MSIIFLTKLSLYKTIFLFDLLSDFIIFVLISILQGVSDESGQTVIKITQDEKTKLKYLAFLEDEEIVNVFLNYTEEPLELAKQLKVLASRTTQSKINMLKVICWVSVLNTG